MLNLIVSFSVRFRGVVVALACLLLGYGWFEVRKAPLDVFPEFVQPQVAVQTEAPGLLPEQVEMLVTRPVEAAINGLGGLESLRSESIQGLSVITVVFAENSDIHISRQALAEKLGEIAGRLPQGVQPPKMSALTSSTMDVLKIGLLSAKLGPRELRTFADWTLKPRLLAVPGIARCNVFGGEVRQWQIRVQPERLAARNLTLTDVLAAARAASGVRGAGFIDTPNQRVLLQTDGQLLTAAALGGVIVAYRDGAGVSIRDVAEVVDGAEPKFGDCLIEGKRGVLLTLSTQYGANTLRATRALEAALDEMRPAMEREGIELHDRLHRPATFIENSLANVRHSLLVGAGLVSIVLFLFLGSFRTAFISLTAIPLSLLAAAVILQKMGISLNTITLGGFAIAIGEVVDDAIIDVENIFRRLRENVSLPAPRPVMRVILDASLEVRTAVVYATFIVALVFVPVFTLSGLQGKFFAPLALAYVLAIMASLAVALTLTPALSYLLWGRGVRDKEENGLRRLLKWSYAHLLGLVSRWPKLVISLVAVVCLGAVSRARSFSQELMPVFREGHFVIQVAAAPGTSLDEMLRIGGIVTRELRSIDGIATIEQQVGRAEQGEDTWGPHRSEFHVELKTLPGEEQEAIEKKIRAALGEIPGIQTEVLTFLGDRLSETLSGETAPVVINVFGDDLDALDGAAGGIAEVLRSVPGAEDVVVKAPPGSPRQVIRLLPEKLAEFGLRPLEVLEAVQTCYQGIVVAQNYQENRVTDIAVVLDPSRRHDPESVGNLMLNNSQGARVALHEVADVYPGSGRFSILHDGARRKQTVTANPKGTDLAVFVENARRMVHEKVQLPSGVYLSFEGAAQAAEEARDELLLHSSIAGVGILLLLAVVLRSSSNLLLVLANLPFALVGGVGAIWFSSVVRGQPASLSIGSLVGFVTLFGITTRNSIMMLSHFEHLVSEEGCVWSWETARRGASERLVPILMTALVTALGLLPLALGSGEAGREIEGPMALVILGGLVTSTFLNLLVLPTLAWWYGSFGRTAEAA
jgi:CzcA family heavy metal efflux pump